MAGLFVLLADLHMEDDDGNNWTLVELGEFRPEVVHPGALVVAGRGEFTTLSTVLRTELFETRSGRQAILVTFRPGLSNGDRRRVRRWWGVRGAT